MNNKTISISTAEKEIMEILWDESPMDAGEIAQHLKKKKDVHPNTVKTLLSRLVKKQAVAFHEKNRKYHYYPILDEIKKLKQLINTLEQDNE